MINEQKMLIHQILSKFPLIVIKLQDVKKGEREWTMELLRKLLNQHIIIQENAQSRVANAKGRVYTYDNRQVKQDEVPVDIYPHQNLIKVTDEYVMTPVETFATNVYRGSGKVKCCVFCKGNHYYDERENCKLLTERKRKLITQG